MNPSIDLTRAGAVLAAIGVAAAFAATPAGAAAPSRTCESMAGQTLKASTSTLPIAGGRVASAERVTLKSGAYCRLKGELAPTSLMGWPILFQVNLPADWNGKGIQYGGGGTNGVLVTAEAALWGSPPGTATPLEQGYATFGTDAGHPILEPDRQLFAFNDEAVVNQAYASYKKVYDVAKYLMSSYYGAAPKRMYFVGNSEGGREGLLVAQRYPADYDGVLVSVPAFNWAAQHIGHYREWEKQQNGGWLPPQKLAVVQAAVRAACDRLDGLEDGVVSVFEGCAKAFDPKPLACPSGDDSGPTCLSAPQIAFLNTVHGRKAFNVTLANGISSYPGSPYGAETGFIPALAPPKAPAPGDLGRPLAGPGSVRYFFVHDPDFTGVFDERAFKDRVQTLSAMFDTTNPDLSAFAARGGRLIIRESGADYLRSPGGSYDYYQAVVQKMGQSRADAVMRLYVQPGLGHSSSGVDKNGVDLPNKVDLFSTLVEWVERGAAPGEPVAVSYGREGAQSPIASRPLCRYPRYPHYVAGDPTSAASFACRSEGEAIR